MKATLLSIAALAASVLADTVTTTTTTTTTACAAEAILDACLDTTESYIALCQAQDYSCLCEKYTTVMTCFANCPNDDRQYALDGERQLYCADASAFSTKTTTTYVTQSDTSSYPTNDATPTDSDSGSGSGSGSGDDDDNATTTYGGGGDATATEGGFPTATAGAVNIVAVGQHGPGLLAAFGMAAAAFF